MGQDNRDLVESFRFKLLHHEDNLLKTENMFCNNNQSNKTDAGQTIRDRAALEMILMAMYAQQSLNLTVGVLMIPLS
jgi:hypothetical protein